MREFFDDGFPPGEQIPRHMEIVLTAEPGPFGEVVRMTVNGTRTGDPLTDNSWAETGYRWHDALHLAHAVCLGWSPVLRSLAGIKRRSDPRTDHVEDGGRAAVADEAIAWAVFCHARTRGWYASRPPEASLLRTVQEMTYALEVSGTTPGEWVHAITTGLSCLRAVWANGGGVLIGDLRTKTLSFTGPAPGGPAPSAPLAAPTWAGTGSRSAPGSGGTPA
jgi:MazG C-terminal domain